MCANIAIELDGLRLITHGVARPAPNLPFAGGRVVEKFASDKAMQIGLDRCSCSADMDTPKRTRSGAGTATVPSVSPRRRGFNKAGLLQPGVPQTPPHERKSAHGNQSRNAPQAGSSYSERRIRAPPRCYARFRGSTTSASTVRWSSRYARHPFRGHLRSQDILFRPALRPRQHRRVRETSTAATCLPCSMRSRSVGDIALLSVPRRGLGNAAISGVATDEQLERLGKDVWAAMAITEPSFGSIRPQSVPRPLDGDEYVINGERSSSQRVRVPHIVVWATLDKSLGRAAIKSFIVPRQHLASPSNDWSTSSGSRRPTPRSSASTTCGSPRTTCSAIRRSKADKGFRSDGDLRQHPADRSPPWRSESLVRPSKTSARSRPTRVSKSPATSPLMRRARRRPNSFAWKPTGRPAIC